MVRVTNSMMIGTLLRNLNNNAGRMSKYQEQLSSEMRINKLSDDPLGVIVSLRARNSRANLEMYQKNLDSANAWMTAGETALYDVNQLIQTMYEDAVYLSTDAKTGYDRKIAANKVKEFRDELVHMLNSSISDKYLFGGYNSQNAPFEVKNGSIYYNTFRMDAYETQELNFEHFQAGMAEIMHKLAQELNPPTNNEVTVSIMEQTKSYINQMIDAAGQAYKQRDCSLADLTGAMKVVRDYTEVQLQSAPAPTGLYTDAIMNALDAVINLAQFEGADEEALEQATPKLLMDNMGMLSDVMKEMITQAKTVDEGSSWTVADALQPKAAQYRAESDLAIQYPSLLAKEGDKAYEIVVGFGLTMDVCMNGVDIMGVGANNLYKILDDMYEALIREYVDYSLDDDYVTSDVIDSLDTYVRAIAGDAAYVDTDARKDMLHDTLTTLQSMIQAGIDASKIETQYSISDPQGNVLINTQGGVSLGGGYSFNFLDKTIRDSNGNVVVDADGAIKVTDSSIVMSGSQIVTSGGVLLRDNSDDTVYLDDATQIIDAAGNLLHNGNIVADSKGALVDGTYTKTVETVTMTTDIIKQAIVAAADANWADGSYEKDMYNEVMQLIEDYTAGGATVDELVRALSTMKSAVADLASEIASVPSAGTSDDLIAKANNAVVTVRMAKYQNNNSLPTDEKGNPIGYRTEGSRAEDIQPFIPMLQKGQRDVLALIAIYGGRANRCEILENRYDIDNINYTTRISNVEDIDAAEVIMYYKMAESVYNAALSAGAKVIQPTLMDFLR